MKKREFLDRLKAALMNRISSQALVENINYYEDYINTQVRMGEAEEDVIAKLGDPRLLAKNIIDSEKRKGNANDYYEADTSHTTNERTYGNNTYGNNTYGNNVYGNNTYENNDQGNWQQNTTQNRKHLPAGVIVLLVFLGIFLFVGLILSILFSVVSFLLPIILPVMLVVFIIKLMRKA